MKTAKWQDYSVITTGDGYKLERWGDIVLLRPDPQAIWKSRTDMDGYKGLSAKYIRSGEGGGKWKYFSLIMFNSTHYFANIPDCFCTVTSSHLCPEQP